MIYLFSEDLDRVHINSSDNLFSFHYNLSYFITKIASYKCSVNIFDKFLSSIAFVSLKGYN